jgi:peptidyl-prolyl cis-trans isomerase A (cyclophilin A)
MKRGIILLAWALAGCGGGGSASDSASESNAGAVVAASLSAKPLADNQVRLSLTGAPAGRYCIRQVTDQPLASDSCFGDQLQQVQTIANPSDTARVTFTAWVLSNTGSVSRHASVSLPGKTCSAAAYASIANTSLPAVCVITSAGESMLRLEPVKAPVSTANFLRYVNQGFYDQTIAMARTSDPDSATAGFFVNTGANTGFDSTTTRDGYAVFGQVVHGTSAWASLLTTAVPGSGEVQNPASPLWLRWAYQIQ